MMPIIARMGRRPPEAVTVELHDFGVGSERPVRFGQRVTRVLESAVQLVERPENRALDHPCL